MANCGPRALLPCAEGLPLPPQTQGHSEDQLEKRGLCTFLVQCLQLHAEVTELDQNPKGHSELSQLGNGENFQVEGVPWYKNQEQQGVQQSPGILSGKSHPLVESRPLYKAQRSSGVNPKINAEGISPEC